MQKLKQAMKRHGLSEAETARRLGIAQSALNRITYRGLPPTLQTAAKIVAGFDGEIRFEDLVPSDVKRRVRKYRGRLVS
jgi:transcriptional regulator with XRE-family HTH domain